MAWDITRNDAFAIRLYSFAQQVRALAWEAYQIAGIAQANGVVTDPAFVAARGVSKDDATSAIGLAADIVAFVQNGPVTQDNREAILDRILAGPTT